MGESVTEATITNWLKNIGDQVEMDEPLVEVATDKVDNELPSEGSGTLIKIYFEKDQVAQVGDVIAVLSNDNSNNVESLEVGLGFDRDAKVGEDLQGQLDVRGARRI